MHGGFFYWKLLLLIDVMPTTHTENPPRSSGDGNVCFEAPSQELEMTSPLKINDKVLLFCLELNANFLSFSFLKSST